MARNSITFKLDNLDEVLRSLADYESELNKKIRKVVVEAADNMEAHAVGNVAVDTGNLKSTIRKEVSKEGKPYHAARVKAGKYGTKDGAAHAHLVEYGTVKMAERPYMRPAYEAEKGRFEKSIEEAIKKT